MKTQDIRQAFLDFFARKNHKVVPSSSLLPKDDPTILFTNAGMNQFKNIFLGLEKRSYKRAVTVQKCMRVSGKHNDLEQVGRTSKHHTFFEMLGNFSFGDYFKREAIAFAWELITGVYKLPKDRLYVTVHEEDDEAFKIWSGEAGVPEDRIFRLGKEENFWAMGETGPCGPCSEIHYDLDPAYEQGTPKALIEKGSDRYSELWNLVFMQYFQDEKGILHPLPSPSIDTGMGLERMAASLQHKVSNFDTDLFTPLIRKICELSSREYPAHDDGDISVRLIADHARAIAFLVGDGIMPANDGRGYVLRRLIRRAFRHGNLINIDKPFLFKLVGVVSDIMKDAYPELLSSLDFISKICHAEEERFAQTLSSGLRYFLHFVKEAKKSGLKTLTGEAAFKLYDTFGFPLDLSQELAQEEGVAVDEAGFRERLDKQRERARQSWKGDVQKEDRKIYEQISHSRVYFSGYEQERIPEARVLGIFKDGARTSELREGDEGEAVLDVTPFYAEAGGQVGDTGVWKNPHCSVAVRDTFLPIPGIISHRVKILGGILKEGATVEAIVDGGRRRAVRANHTATHLLHASLRQVLGDHVKQAGSLVSPERLRFDFVHYQSLAEEEIRKVERLVNEKIRANIPVNITETTLEEGIKQGATAIFEEKYGEKVRMVDVGDFSKELCGGVHVPLTGEIGLFKVVEETSVAAGMRRIEAVSGETALEYVQGTESLIQEAVHSLNVSRKDVVAQIERLKELVKEKEHELRMERQKMLRGKIEHHAEEIKTVKGVSVLIKKIEGLDPAEARSLVDSLKQKITSGVIVLGSVREEKVFLVVGVTKDITARLSAVDVIKRVAPLVDGGGGGRPDFAQAGGTNAAGLDKALKECLAQIEQHL
jgi:alanyl-tRNA synthetase